MTKTYAIIVDKGYGIDHKSSTQFPVDFIEAETAQKARKIFKKNWAGHPYADREFRATTR